MPVLDFDAKVERTLEAIEESEDITDYNADLLREYHRDRVLGGISPATQQKNMAYLKKVAEYAGETSLDEMDTADVKGIVERLHNRDLAESTVDTYKEIIRLFWVWMSDEDDADDVEEVAWMEHNGNHDNDTLPKDLLTKEDVRAQIEAANNRRDKALISILYETGARIGELIDLTVGDIEDRKHGKKVVVEGKTGARRLPLVESVPHINKWLNEHPNPEKDAPLWCKIQQGGPDDQLGYRYVREKILKKTMDDAGIDKPSNPHHYRHSRASYLANELKEAQLCAYFGWVQGSDVPAKYVHLSGRDIDDAIDAMHGLVDPEADEDEPDVIECWRCEELNEPDDRYCGKCGAPLDEEAREIEAEVQEDVGAEKVLADLEESGELSSEQVEEIANDDAIMAKLIEARAKRSG